MNSQERDQLSQFLKQLEEVRLTTKDAEAETLIREGVAKQSDAAYLMVQRILLQEQALNNAKARIDELQNQLQNSQAGQKGAGFLGGDPWAQSAGNTAPVPGAGSYQVPRYAAQPQMPPQAQPSGGVFGGGSSFLGNVATTAAGVVAGSFLFQGIESLMGHHGSGGGWGQQHPVEENVTEQIVINNYYGDDAEQLADNSDNERNDYLISDNDDGFVDDGDDSDWI